MKKVLLLILVVVSIDALAQDIHLSQFYTSEHLLNPAKVGDFEGDYRFIGNFRNQWRQINSDPINTFVASFDRAFRYYSQEFDAGILLAHDEFTGFNTLTTKVLLSLGYGISVKGHRFRLGIQPGMVFRRTDLSTQTFPEQWNYNPGPNSNSATGFFDPLMPDKETQLNKSENYFDLNAGVQWAKRWGKFEPKLGVGLNHINKPKDSFFDKHIERLRVRKVYYAEINYYMGKFILQPKYLWMWTTKNNDMILGTNLKYKTNHKVLTSVFGGVYYRNGADRNVDALFPVIGFGIKRFDLGFSYDVNVSSLSKDMEKRRGTFEFSIIYTAPSSQTKYITLPCDRY